ncbi:MAG: methyltransferase [Flavipsychrobacter sp.]|jgi:16S rRNA (cytosine967-C5)-methyltransferase|nr:methyltransferase [Flavipsychrobacter sp.]
MRYILQHIKNIVRTYDGSIPLTYFLKNFFKVNPKLGSRDRKILSDMAYSWYRCSKGFEYAVPFEEKLNAALYLCDTQSNHVLSFLPAEWQQTKALDIAQKIQLLSAKNISFNIEKLAAFKAELSEDITRSEWLHSMLQQPRLFIRVRDKDLVPMLLQEHNVPYLWINESCMSIANGSPVDKILVEDSYVVQDASSQATGNYFHPTAGEAWWDCCSGAGGKSLLLKDITGDIALTVSDKRETIIHNLLQRFQQYHHNTPDAHVFDLTNEEGLKDSMAGKEFDSIIADVPCTGSGTWARTPEQLYFFKQAAIDEIAKLQTTIAVNASKLLKPGGNFFYITCSVFKKENEMVVENIMQQTGMTLREQQLINGIGQKADSMFITVLKKK